MPTESTLRDTLADALNNAEEIERPAPATPEAPAVETATPETPAVEEPAKPGRTAGRARDEHGKLLPGKAKREEQPAALLTPAPARKPPSSWKKEYWDAYAKLDEPLAKYIEEREFQFANGVSTYKQEAERARELQEAIAPFQADLQQYNIHPAQWIRNLGAAHQTLAKGSPQDKLVMMSRLVREYGVPAKLAIQDQAGNWQFVDERQFPQPSQPAVDPQQIQKLVQNTILQQRMQDEVQQFLSDTEKYPHAAAVREQMVGLLQSGLAPDLPSAYKQAIRLNDELWQAEQQKQSQANAEKQRQEAQARVQKARANAVSTKSATPSSAMTGDGKKGTRKILEDAFNELDGRV